MKRKTALSQRFEALFCLAALSAHAQHKEKNGFRQRDVRFFVDLYANWIETALDSHNLAIQNTQAQRFLTSLVTEAYASQSKPKAKAPRYRLTRIGMLEMLTRLTRRSYTHERELFFLVFYSIKNFQSLLLELVNREGREFPYALKVELENLLDEQDLLRREIKATQDEIRKLEERIDEHFASAKLAESMQAKAASESDIFAAIQINYPYALNNQIPLKELMSKLPVEIRQFELQFGAMRRGRQVFEPAKKLMQAYLRELRHLT